jgi:hypothetical protein
MFKFTFVKTPKPRAFYHRPINWNPEEEERKERLERVRKDLGERDENQPYKASIKRGSFRRGRWEQPDETPDMHTERRRSNVRLFVIILVLLALAAVLYLTSSAYLSL